MWRYVLKRVIALIPVLIAVSFLLFLLVDLAPGSVLDLIANDYSQEQYAQLEHELGYDRSVVYRYGLYMRNLLRGDLGTSAIHKTGVWNIYMGRFPSTLKLAFASFLVAIGLSLPLGIYAATHRGSLQDNLAMTTSIIGLSMPNFWLGLMLIILFALKLGWLPSGQDKNGILSLILPAFTIGTGHMAMMTRTVRSSMLDVIRADYLVTARAMGVPEKRIVNKHALRNALIPILTIMGGTLGASFAGATVTETVFSWPGVGRLTVDAINTRDTTLITGCIILTTTFIAIVNLITDLLYAFVDPRLKSQYTRSRSEGKRKKDTGASPAPEEGEKL